MLAALLEILLTDVQTTLHYLAYHVLHDTRYLLILILWSFSLCAES